MIPRLTAAVEPWLNGLRDLACVVLWIGGGVAVGLFIGVLSWQ